MGETHLSRGTPAQILKTLEIDFFGLDTCKIFQFFAAFSLGVPVCNFQQNHFALVHSQQRLIMEVKTVLSLEISARLHIFFDEYVGIKLIRKRVETLGPGTAQPHSMLLEPEDLLTMAKARPIVEVLANELNTEKKIPFPSTVLSLDLTPGLNLTIWEDLTI